MYVPPWVIVAGILIIAILAYLALRSRKTIAANPRLTPASKAPSPAVIESLRQNLRLKTGYNEPLIDRLIQFERGRLPNGSLQTWMEAAIERYERDNR
jgi:hypothetical protein